MMVKFVHVKGKYIAIDHIQSLQFNDPQHLVMGSGERIDLSLHESRLVGQVIDSSCVVFHTGDCLAVYDQDDVQSEIDFTIKMLGADVGFKPVYKIGKNSYSILVNDRYQSEWYMNNSDTMSDVRDKIDSLYKDWLAQKERLSKELLDDGRGD